MTHPQLAVFGYSEASMFPRRTPKPHVSAIISIHGAREFGIQAEAMHRLDLNFDDIEVAAASDMLALQRAVSRKRRAQTDGLFETAPIEADARSIIEFAEMVRGENGIVLCHCGGGMSRAPAAALICLAVWRGRGSEVDCVAEILSLRRGAVPHVGLVGFADKILGCSNELVNALRNRTGFGTE